MVVQALRGVNSVIQPRAKKSSIISTKPQSLNFYSNRHNTRSDTRTRAMETLPQEIYDQIALHLSRRRGQNSIEAVLFKYTNKGKQPESMLAKVACVSRRWQETIEPEIFRSLYIRDGDVDGLEHIVVGRRRQYLSELRVRLELPCPKPRRHRGYLHMYETEDERTAINILATARTKRVLEILESWGGPFKALSFQLHFGPPDDLVVRSPRDSPWRYSFLSINTDGFPMVDCVTDFSAVGRSGREFDPTSIICLMKCFPNLTAFDMEFHEPDTFHLLRKDLRDDFSRTLQATLLCLPPMLENLHFAWILPGIFQAERLPDLTAPLGYDVVSASLRKISANAKTFYVTGNPDPTLFWPAAEEGIDLEPFWPNLESLTLHMLNPTSPSGRWYLRSSGPEDDTSHIMLGDMPLPLDRPLFRPPGFGPKAGWQEADRFQRNWIVDRANFQDNNMAADHFRTWPDEGVFVPLVEAFARALTHMPRIKSATLMMDSDDSYTINIDYAAPGEQVHEDIRMQPHEEPPLSVPRVSIHTYSWRMGEKLEQMFRDIGLKFHGQESVLRYLPDLYGGGSEWSTTDSGTDVDG